MGECSDVVDIIFTLPVIQNIVNRTKPFICRQLCLDALVEEGDVNMDWRLGYEEYREIMKEEYLPSTQGE